MFKTIQTKLRIGTLVFIHFSLLFFNPCMWKLFLEVSLSIPALKKEFIGVTNFLLKSYQKVTCCLYCIIQKSYVSLS